MADYSRERQAAIEAGLQAAELCQRVQQEMVASGAGTVQKGDRSPVTVADFGAQALVSKVLEEYFPNDAIVGEESSGMLRQSEQDAVRARVVGHVAEQVSGVGEDRVLEWIDRGGHEGGTERFWTLDPIDGTKGFLRAEQYAVALSLLVDCVPTVGILACPNLPWQWGDDGDAKGCLFVAVKGQGAFVRPLAGDTETPIRASAQNDPREARVLESVERAHGDHDAHDVVKGNLGIAVDSVRLDSQAKYGVLSRGEAEVYLRLPTRPGYREWIWDQAAGVVVIEEAGGRVTDAYGRALDFGKGRRLEENQGIVATNGTLHDRVIEQVRKVLS